MYSLVTYYPDLKHIGIVCQSESWEDLLTVFEDLADEENHTLTEADRESLDKHMVCRLPTIHIFITDQSYMAE